MSKGFLQVDVLQISSDHFKGKKFQLKIEANDSSFILSFTDIPTKINEHPRYLPLAQEMLIKLYEDQKDNTIGYFKLPVTKIYEHPNKNNIVNVNCVWFEKADNKVIEGAAATVKLSIHYLKDVSAKLQILVEKAILTNDTQSFGKMDPFVECKVGDVMSKTNVKDEAGKTPQWQEVLPFRLENIPGWIDFAVKDKDMTNDDIVGSARLNPHQNNVFFPKKQMEKREIQIFCDGKSAGKLYISTIFEIDA